MTDELTPVELVERSVRRYRRRHRDYERLHPEIFNAREQARLRNELECVVADLDTASPRALDLGCGSGNVTAHLIALGATVTAADVSPEFLADVKARFGAQVATLRLNGIDLSPIPNGSLDLVCAYSVLHHIPDYLHTIDEVCRVLVPGGIAYLDHEADPRFYDANGCFRALLAAVERHRRERPGAWNPARRQWQRHLQPSQWALRARRLVNPAHPWDVEGDIHVWETDRIEWDAIEARLAAAGCTVVRRVDYLNYSTEYPDEVWARFDGQCTNMRLLVARRAG